jgi:iron complex transport system permease protein
VLYAERLRERWPAARGRANAAWRPPGYAVLPPLALLVTGAALAGVGIGALPISPAQAAAILLHQVGVGLPVEYTQQQEAVLLAIRLPRVLLALLIGAGLAVSGATAQAVFRNPLADPSIIGVSAGAAVGAVAVIVLGLRPLGVFTLPVAAFLGGLLTTLLIYRLARAGGRVEVTTLLLVGLAIEAFLGAVTSFLTFLATDPQLRSIVFWRLGGLGAATWPAVLGAGPLLLVGILWLPRLGRPFNLLVLGEAEAAHLGVATERVRLAAIVLAALATGAGVAVAGIVSFVGLVVPHLLRLLIGPDHRALLPASALGGALLLLLADLAARTIVAPAELPLGIVTAATGAPFFLYLILRTRAAHGGWG